MQDRTALIKRTLPSASTENPAYGISSYWPYYCECCSCCCDSESDSESSYSTSSSDDESISLSCSSISSTTTSEDELEDDNHSRTQYSTVSYDTHKSGYVSSTTSSDEPIRFGGSKKHQSELTISTKLKMQDGTSECIQVQFANIHLDGNSVVVLKRSNSVGRRSPAPIKARVSGRRKADSWAGVQEPAEKDESCVGRREQKKGRLFTPTSDLSKLKEGISCAPQTIGSVRKNVDHEPSLGTRLSHRSRIKSIDDIMSRSEKRRDLEASKQRPKSRSLEFFKGDNINIFGNTMDTDENKLIKMDNSVKEQTKDDSITKTFEFSRKPEEALKAFPKNNQNESMEKLLEQGSENRPANIPMVVMQTCPLQLILNPASRDIISVPMGTIVNALYKYQDNLRVKTPHGDEGLLNYSNCAPLVNLPTKRAKDSKIYQRTPIMNIPIIKPKAISSKLLNGSNGSLHSPNIPKTRLLESRLKQVKCWEDNDMDILASKNMSAPPDESLTLGMTLTEGPILKIINDYESRGRSTLSVKHGEHVTLLNKDLKDWVWVRASSGREGFVPQSHVSSLQNILKQVQ